MASRLDGGDSIFESGNLQSQREFIAFLKQQIEQKDREIERQFEIIQRLLEKALTGEEK